MSSETAVSPRGDTEAPPRADIEARTLRQDRWWLQPLIIALGFAAFVVYATWAAFNHPIVAGTGHRIYYAHPYLSPLYSPCFVKGCPPQADWAQLAGPQWISPALYILIFPLAFRTTCYYYRKAYYRSFWLSPPACAVAEPHRTYTGERRFPLILNNIHRWFWYAAVVVALILSFDTVLTFRNADGEWGHMGLGSLVMVVNVLLIAGYTFSCHSCRHIMGGRINNFSKRPIRYWFWTQVSRLNVRHGFFAWTSLFSVALCDLYIRLVSAGVFDDPRFF